MHDYNLSLILPVYTSFDDLRHISRLQVRRKRRTASFVVCLFVFVQQVLIPSGLNFVFLIVRCMDNTKFV